MKTKGDHRFNSISIIVPGCLIVAVILTIGTFALGRVANNDTKEAVRNVSLLYLSELAGRREQVVSSVLNDYVSDLDVAAGMLTAEDLSSTEALQDYQLRLKQLYDLDKFAFIDTDGVIYTSRGTRSDIEHYSIDYKNLTEPEISVKNLNTSDKKIVIVIPVDNLAFEDKTLIACFMELDMDKLLRNVSIQTNNNTTFCNIYTKDGISLTDMVLGGLASEDNLLEAMEHAVYESGYSYEKLKQDFKDNRSGEVSFSYSGISETLYYIPVRGTNWMLTYLIRESIIEEQINSISNTIIVRSVIQSALTALVLIIMFSLMFIQQRKTAKDALEREVTEAENRVRQQELEEQLAMQEELASKSEELEKALQAAEDANRAKSGFVSNMSHEIRTPITAILGMNEMIRRECDNENIRAYADNISAAGESLLGIISDILDFSKIEAGRMELSLAGYSPAVLINDLYNLIRFRTEVKGLNLIFNIDRTIPRGLIGDELRLKQIISNLLTNAAKYTEKGDVCLDIRCVEKDIEGARARLLISVSDTGIGIRADEKDKLFVPFDRLDMSRTRSIEGAGLGLSISRQLLQMMDSELMVESIYEKGSRFYFTLWQGMTNPEGMGEFIPDKAPRIRDNKEAKKYFKAPGKRILVVDDMPMNLQVMTGLLKQSEMIIETASGGEECIQKFGATDYDIVFLDYRMPEMDGIETLHRLKDLYPDKCARIPVIALTASAIMGDREKLLGEGFTDYLSKPVVISDMEQVITRYLGESTENAPSENKSPDTSVITKGGTGDGISDITKDLPQDILLIHALDHDRGLEYCGDAEDYLFALKTYADSVEEKASALEACLDEDRIGDYTLLIHSLKSMSKAIGALELYEQAKALEKAGADGLKDVILSGTRSFIKEYRALGAELMTALPCLPGEQ